MRIRNKLCASRDDMRVVFDNCSCIVLITYIHVGITRYKHAPMATKPEFLP